jgi:hypothetical protein
MKAGGCLGNLRASYGVEEMLQTNDVYLALIIYFNSVTFVNFLNLNKHQPHAVGGSNYKIMLLCKPPKCSAFFFFYLHFQNGCILKNLILLLLLQGEIISSEPCFLPLKITENNAEIQNKRFKLNPMGYNHSTLYLDGFNLNAIINRRKFNIRFC